MVYVLAFSNTKGQRSLVGKSLVRKADAGVFADKELAKGLEVFVLEVGDYSDDHSLGLGSD